jgi:glycosyltransferase involved in cell wall biosynthesis
MLRYVDKTVFLFLWHFILFFVSSVGSKRILIKSPHPADKRRFLWGDYHLAKDLAAGFQHSDQSVRCFIVPFEYWNMPLVNYFAYCSIVVSGVSRCEVSRYHPHYIYVISHPEIINPAYLNGFRAVMVASHQCVDRLTEKGINALFVPQFSNSNRFEEKIEENSPFKGQVVFVGNTRGEYREAVKVCVENNIPISVYGSGWEKYISPSYIKANYLDNNQLHECYSNASIVLNDHWPAMRKQGFLSNRVFDVGMCGGFVLSDSVAGLPEELTQCFEAYENGEELVHKIQYFLNHPEEREKRRQQSKSIVQQNYSHINVAETMLAIIQEHTK